MKFNSKKTNKIFIFTGIVIIILIFFRLQISPLLISDSTELKTVNTATFQVKFPSKYFVTSDEMVTSYLSRGGQAPPVLIFSTKDQALEKSNNKDNLKDADIIQIWSTLGFSSFNDWYENSGGSGEVLSEKTVVYGNYKFIKRVVNVGMNKTVSQALITSPELATYYFTTSDSSLDKDLDIILQNFRTRDQELKK